MVFIEMVVHLMLMHICKGDLRPFDKKGAWVTAIFPLYITSENNAVADALSRLDLQRLETLLSFPFCPFCPSRSSLCSLCSALLPLSPLALSTPHIIFR